MTRWTTEDLFAVIIVVGLLFGLVLAYSFGYRNGQINALKGNIEYKRVITETYEPIK